jgi:hypothetical protein
MNTSLLTNISLHILAAKLSRANFLLRRVSNLVSKNTMRKLYFSLFHSHLLYCSNIYSCTSLANLNRISILQKISIRIITGSGPYAHTEELFLNNRILTFEKIILLNKLLFMPSIAYNYAPQSFAGKKMMLGRQVTIFAMMIFSFAPCPYRTFLKITCVCPPISLEHSA